MAKQKKEKSELAKQLRRRAGRARALSQLDALDIKRRIEFIQSALTARAAASGGGAADPTVQDIAGDIAEEGRFRELLALSQGEFAAADFLTAAGLREFEAREARKAGRVSRRFARGAAIGTLLESVDAETLFAKFGEFFDDEDIDFRTGASV